MACTLVLQGGMLNSQWFSELSIHTLFSWLSACPQVLQWVMSYDGVSSTEAMAITAASASLLVSGVCEVGTDRFASCLRLS